MVGTTAPSTNPASRTLLRLLLVWRFLFQRRVDDPSHLKVLWTFELLRDRLQTRILNQMGQLVEAFCTIPHLFRRVFLLEIKIIKAEEMITVGPAFQEIQGLEVLRSRVDS